MSRPWLVIPVKPLSEGKSRLMRTLSGEQRAELIRHSLAHELALARASALFAQILVVSRDADVRGLAAAAGALTLAEEGDSLNAALHDARDFALAGGAGSLLMLPADVPLVTGDDLLRLCRAAQDNQVVIAPSHDGGTNALLLTPPQVVDFAFGPGSFSRHREMARTRRVEYAILYSATLALDIDWPQDVANLLRLYPAITGTPVPWFHPADSPILNASSPQA